MTHVEDTTPVRAFPPVLARNLMSVGGGVAAARGHLEALHDLAPAAADGVAGDLAAEALALIRDGHAAPGRLAGDVLAVCAAAGGRWAR